MREMWSRLAGTAGRGEGWLITTGGRSSAGGARSAATGPFANPGSTSPNACCRTSASPIGPATPLGFAAGYA
jgi:hypothetical protein